VSRIGLKEIQIPQGVTVNVVDGGKYNYKEVQVTGLKGTLAESIRRGVTIKVEDNTVRLERESESKENKSFHGLYRSLINNMVEGVTNGYSKELEIVGIGYRAEAKGTNIIFSLGYSHKIELEPPVGILVTILEPTRVKVEGADKQLVGEIAAKIRAFKKPEPYKGKGVRYVNEKVKKKSAKSVGA
jgi:large subunit ribosomal protein L6